MEEYVGGHYDKVQKKYIGGQYNVRERFYEGDSENYYKCTRIGYTDASKTTKLEEKQYYFLDDKQTEAIVHVNDENGERYEICHFYPNAEKCELRYFIRTDDRIEVWHYTGDIRTEVTVTYPTGTDAYYNEAGEEVDKDGEPSKGTWKSVDIDTIEKEYGSEWAIERQNQNLERIIDKFLELTYNTEEWVTERQNLINFINDLYDKEVV